MLPISLLDSPGALAWDSLPLIKLTCFPFACGHTLPFSQARQFPEGHDWRYGTGWCDFHRRQRF